MNEYLTIALRQGVAILAGGVITYLINIVNEKKAQLAEKDKLIEKLIENDRAKLRQDIVNTYYLWADRGYMPIVVKEALYSCHERYHQSGGNGFIDGIMAKVKDLPSQEVG